MPDHMPGFRNSSKRERTKAACDAGDRIPDLPLSQWRRDELSLTCPFQAKSHLLVPDLRVIQRERGTK